MESPVAISQMTYYIHTTHLYDVLYLLAEEFYCLKWNNNVCFFFFLLEVEAISQSIATAHKVAPLALE